MAGNNRIKDSLYGLTSRNPFVQYRMNQNIKERQYFTADDIRVIITHESAYKKLVYIGGLLVFAVLLPITLIINGKTDAYCRDKR